MSDDQFTKLYKYMQEFRGEFKQHQEDSKHELADIRGAIAELGAQIREYHQEMIMFSRQVDRLREAIKQIAAETGVKLKVEI